MSEISEPDLDIPEEIPAVDPEDDEDEEGES